MPDTRLTGLSVRLVSLREYPTLGGTSGNTFCTMFPVEMIIDSHEHIMFPAKLQLAKMDAALLFMGQECALAVHSVRT